ncbi:hypothetical protein SPBRAN_332 [uncultured Candidatus Thioglobus sp.]|nr:hypothetical protein SPBRAN_332 [uncultured Candidatus Thioglobus sp.]
MNLVFSKKFTKKFSKYTPAIQKQVYQAIKRIPLGDVKF